jgi:hypothetical protein
MRAGGTLAIAVLALVSACDAGGKGECTALVDGPWTVTGDGFGMGDAPMQATVTMDVEGCTFAFSDWSMAMSSLPSGGTVDGDEVTLTGDDQFWASCVGTVDEAGASVSGACEGGDAIEMSSGEMQETTM